MKHLKTCSICGLEKPLSEFHRRRHTVRCGYRAACKDCTNRISKAARAEQVKEISAAAAFKAKVRSRTHQLIKKGELIPQACRICGHRAEAHHKNYEDPFAHLVVDWLCKSHHVLEHGKRAWTRQQDMFPVNFLSGPQE